MDSKSPNEFLIGPYVIERKVSEGGMATVYKATHSRTGDRVAIKTIRSPIDSPTHDAVTSRFQSEITQQRRLQHPAIVSIYDNGTLPDGSPYFVMPWVEGRDLEHVITVGGPLRLLSALSIARDIAEALGAAHKMGVVHRDLKPSNVLVLGKDLADPRPIMLLDFGVAGELEEESGKTRGGEFFGTMAYMSPEQVRAAPISAQSDIWQLGVTLFEMLFGSAPFKGNTFDLMTSIVTLQVPMPDATQLPEPVTSFLLECLAKDPNYRPRNGQDAVTRIDVLLAYVTSKGLEDLRYEITVNPTEASLSAKRPSSQSWLRMSEPHGSVIQRGSLMALLALTLFASLPIRLTRVPFVPWRGLSLGFVLLVGGVWLGRAIKQSILARRSAISLQTTDVLSNARNREQLSQTMAIQVNEIVAKCRLIDEKFLGITMALMIDEYSVSTTFDDRQKALMNAVTLLEKLTPKLSPWYIRHDKVVALIVTLVGIVSGLATIAQTLTKLIKGS